jgi:hypothetical protein
MTAPISQLAQQQTSPFEYSSRIIRLIDPLPRGAMPPKMQIVIAKATTLPAHEGQMGHLSNARRLVGKSGKLYERETGLSHCGL